MDPLLGVQTTSPSIFTGVSSGSSLSLLLLSTASLPTARRSLEDEEEEVDAVDESIDEMFFSTMPSPEVEEETCLFFKSSSSATSLTPTSLTLMLTSLMLTSSSTTSLMLMSLPLTSLAVDWRSFLQTSFEDMLITAFAAAVAVFADAAAVVSAVITDAAKVSDDAAGAIVVVVGGGDVGKDVKDTLRFLPSCCRRRRDAESGVDVEIGRGEIDGELGGEWYIDGE